MKIRYAGSLIAIILLIGFSLAESSSSVRGRAPPALDASNPAQRLIMTQEQVVAQAVWPESAGGNGHTYQAILVPGGITWDDANSAANSKGGHLVTIEGKAENQFVYGLIQFEKSQIGLIGDGISESTIWHEDVHGNIIGPWIGGYRSQDYFDPSSQWRWVTRDPWGYTNWAPGEPNNMNGIEDRIVYFSFRTQVPTYCPPGERCAASIQFDWSSGDYWNDFPCKGRTNGYIIEYEKGDLNPPSSPSANFDNHKYQAVRVPEGITWFDARARAISMGGHLATITSFDENQFIYKLVQNDNSFWLQQGWGSGTGPWIGSFRARDGWNWVTDEHSPFAIWAPGEPNNLNPPEEVVAFCGSGGALKGSAWDDLPNDTRLNGFIVEFDNLRDTNKQVGSNQPYNQPKIGAMPYGQGQPMSSGSSGQPFEGQPMNIFSGGSPMGQAYPLYPVGITETPR